MCTKKCTSGKFAREKVHSMCTNVDYVVVVVVNYCEQPNLPIIKLVYGIAAQNLKGYRLDGDN